MIGWRRRIGYISPGSLEIPVYDFYQVAPDGVSLVALTAPISDWADDEYEKNLEQVERAAEYLAKRHVHMVIHAGAPPVASRGRAFLHQMISRMSERTGLPASTALYSAMEACRWLGGERVAVVTPFPAQTHQNIVALLRDEGITVVHEERMDAAFFSLSDISERHIYDFVCGALRRGAQAGADIGYVPCPQWHVFEMVDYLERDTGLPLVTSDGGDFWYAFRTLGVTDVKPGHGLLLDRLSRSARAGSRPATRPGGTGGEGDGSGGADSQGEGMTEATDGLRRRLLDAKAELDRIPVSGPGRLGPPDPATGEQWNRTNVLGHMAEILPFWTDQIKAVVAGAPRIRRDSSGSRARRQAIDLGADKGEEKLRDEIDHGVQGVLDLLGALSPADLAIEADHVRATETRRKNVAELFEQLIVNHFESHVRQLQELS